LKQKELSHMQALAEEWRRRDHQREALIKKKEMEYNLLEEQLQKTLSDLEKREKALAHAETETQRLQRELRAEHEFSLRELQDGGRRLREDCAHQVELERSKVRQIEDLLAQQRQQVNTADASCDRDLWPFKGTSRRGLVTLGSRGHEVTRLMSILSNPLVLKRGVKRFSGNP
ncbi:centrosomal protein of 120 kDa-like, partial [Onychostoma macrolepis]